MKKEMYEVLDSVIDYVISIDHEAIESYVNKLREQNPGIDRDELAQKVLDRKSLKNGLVGAFAGLGGFIVLPVAVPANLVSSWRIQASMAFSIAYIYGHQKNTTDLKTDLYLILAGDSAKAILKELRIVVAEEVAKKAINKYITREIMVNLWKIIGPKIITKAGEKSLTSFMKMTPLVGAPVGFVFDWIATRAVGEFAIKYYKG